MNPTLSALLGIAAMQTGGGEEMTGIAGWVVSVMDAIGGLGAAFLVALENIFPPIPSEVILPLAGFSASDPTSNITLVSAVLWCTAGSLVGAWVLYGLGAWLGRERTRKILLWLPLTKQSDVDKTEAWFDKHGQWTVFFGRMVPIFRSLISLPAGVTRMNPVSFTIMTTVGSLIWNSILIGAGYALGANWAIVEDYVGIFAKIVAAIIVLVVLGWIAHRLYQNRKAGQTD
ncbi:alkaline phosphatase [Actinobaculum suis]|uniref:Alkaline phosphatase n=1 Tax=Actinobaculum suis TaxID=1657 RepID=A0A7Z8YAB3_9ACTO|nr:DedA family protein [Actinobaculum suis]VDG77257.1 alkaline phosphatase [Actinobaculum suis]